MDSNNSKPSTSFRQMVKTLSEAIGEHHIPVVDGVEHLSALIAPDAVHYDLIKKLFQLIYKANHCYHLNAPVSFLPTFDALGEFHVQLISSARADIEQVNLVNEIGSVCVDYFRAQNCYPTDQQFVQSSACVGSEKSKTATTG